MRGLYLVAPHDRWVAEGSKTIVVKSRRFDVAGERMVLVGPEHAWGVVVLEEPVAIDLATFDNLRSRHRITDAERREWWPGDRELWSYKVRSFEPYDAPREWERPQGVQTIVRDVVMKQGEGHAHRFGPYLSSTDRGGSSHTHTIKGKTDPAISSGPLPGDGGHVHRAIIDGEEYMSGPPINAAKLGVGEMVPDRLRDVDDRELLSLNRRLHQLWGGNFEGNDRITAGTLNREDVVNAALFVWAEMQRRGIRVARDSDLWRAAQALRKAEVAVDKYESAMSDREARYEHAAIEGWTDDGGGDVDGPVDAPQDLGG